MVQETVFIEVDYNSWVQVCNSINIISKSVGECLYWLFISYILFQPIQFFAPEIKKFVKEKTTKIKPFRGLGN